MVLALAIAWLLPAVALAGRPRELPPQTASLTLEHDGLVRSYLLFVPRGLAPTRRAPLLVQLHGGGGNAVGMERLTGFASIAMREGFVVATPEGVGKNWNDGRNPDADADDVGFLRSLVELLVESLPIDPGRVSVVGISNGAMLAGRLACEAPDRFAAIAQVAGTFGADLLAGCEPGRAVPVLQIHGTADAVVPYAGGSVLGGRGEVASVDDWAAFWVSNNAASGPSVGALSPDATLRVWSGASLRSQLAFVRVEGGGHTWPGRTANLPVFLVGPTTMSFSASELIWSFLSPHALD